MGPHGTVIFLMAITLRKSSEFFPGQTRSIDHGSNYRGWIMFTITKRPNNAITSNPSRRVCHITLQRNVLQFCSLALAIVAMNCVMSISAEPSPSGVNTPSEWVSQASRIDRSHKSDRLNPVASVTRAALPPGCEPPFSSLAKLSVPTFIGRCLT